MAYIVFQSLPVFVYLVPSEQIYMNRKQDFRFVSSYLITEKFNAMFKNRESFKFSVNENEISKLKNFLAVWTWSQLFSKQKIN